MSAQPETPVRADRFVPSESWPGDDAFDRVYDSKLRRFAAIPFRQLLSYHDFLYFIARRDVALRYKQTVVGIAWTLLQPLLFALVFSVFLGSLAKVQSGNSVPYPVFAVTGLTLWFFVIGVLSRTAGSMIQNANIVTKVFFPRILVPVGASLPPVVDFFIAFVVALATMLVYGVTPKLTLVLVPLVVVLGLLLMLGAGFWLAALNVKYRDFGLIVPLVIQLGLFVTPIIYPVSLVPASRQALYALNPLVGLFEFYRWMLFTDATFPTRSLLITVATMVVLLVSGAMYFQRAQAEFADIV